MTRDQGSESSPLLFRAARTQTLATEDGAPTRYDADRDELLVLLEGRWMPAIDSPSGGPGTKKADVETGEDQKDRW